MKKIIYTSACALLVGAFMLVSSCSKQDDNKVYGGPTSSSDKQELVNKVKSIISNMPQFKVGDPSGRYGVLKSGEKGGGQTTDSGWDFSQTGTGGWGYTSTGSGSWGYSSTGNVVWISSSSGSGSGSAGTVFAGSSALDINYTFCYSAQDNSNIGTFFNGTTFSGVSVIIGVSGDFSALANADSTTNPLDFFNGLAFYVVYDSPSSGDYNVISWYNVTDNNYNPDKKSFAIVIDFKNGRLYMSTDGKVNVNGGSMDFEGNYLEISGFSSNFDFNNISASTVSGYGTMNCNN